MGTCACSWLGDSGSRCRVRGEGWVDAAFALRGEIEDIAVAGFTAALKEGSVHLSAVPVSGDEDAPGMVMLEKVVRD